MTIPGATGSASFGSMYAGRGTHREVVEWLAARIFAGTFAESEVIDLGGVMGELQVSQTVVREAVKVLTAKGLVAARQKRGTVVRPRERWNLLDDDVLRWQLGAGVSEGFYGELHALRCAIEPAAAGLAAGHRTGEDLAALEDALAAMADARGAVPALVEADAAFHTALLAASHNRFFARLHQLIIPGLRQRDLHVHAGAFEDPVPLHAAVVAAVRDGNAEGARRAMNILLERAEQDHARATAADPVLPQ
ncbi:FadR family transcriptional regulator [Nocardia yunnanensis]|uniref:FadR family transcriptional regulator n=1 Tax=Nocardia yunnanensis TaxID=2382165 RepID=A0A386ZHC6_9NOCA|nr:FadR/GntR family transcriptional regulator [Nocardia yunnanensis]AYF76968.1 FadR family transcriptional regulator [Nocardia yunnanensis]